MTWSLSDRPPRVKQNFFGGEGDVILQDIALPDQLLGRARLFAKFTLAPGTSIGYHTHEGEAEYYFLLRGTARCNDNGTERLLKAGDVAATFSGQGHAIANTGSESLEFIALILLEKTHTT